MNAVCRLSLVFLCFIVSGCGSLHLGVKEEQVNVDRYPTAQDFLKNQDLALRKDLSEPVLLKTLKDGTEQKLIQINKAADVQKVLFGDITPHADKKDISDISAWILSHHVFSLPYKNVRTEFAFDPLPISYNFWEFGPDMDLLFITKKNEDDPSSSYILVRTIVAGTENTKTKTKEYIWQGLGTALVGAAKKLIF